jgi:hypothetical protein
VVTERVDLPPRIAAPHGAIPAARPRPWGRALVAFGAVIVLAVAGGAAYAKFGPADDVAKPTALIVGPVGAVPGTVPSSSPSASAGTAIAITPGRMPRLVGFSLDQARTSLTHISIQVTREPARPGVPDGIITAQDPAEGAALPRSVRLTVSSSTSVEHLAPTSGAVRR